MSKIVIRKTSLALEKKRNYGPLMGRPVPLGLVLGSTNLVAIDTVTAKIIGIDPQKHRDICI